jgi:hypothetical protein
MARVSLVDDFDTVEPRRWRPDSCGRGALRFGYDADSALPLLGWLPRNWMLSAMISIAWRLVPSFSHSRHSSRPSMATGRPLAVYLATVSPRLPQTVTSK